MTQIDYTKTGLTFNTRGTAKSAAKLHALNCNMLNVENKRISVIREDVEAEVVDLEEREFTVVRCKCLRLAGIV